MQDGLMYMVIFGFVGMAVFVMVWMYILLPFLGWLSKIGERSPKVALFEAKLHDALDGSGSNEYQGLLLKQYERDIATEKWIEDIEKKARVWRDAQIRREKELNETVRQINVSVNRDGD